MSDFNLEPAETLLFRLQDELSSFSSNSLLDAGILYTQIAWFSNLLGLAVYEKDNTVLKLSDYKAELPCNFFLLDSAWLCEGSSTTEDHLNFQSKMVAYVETTQETVGNNVNCHLPNTLGYLSISACNMDTPVYDKTTIKEYIYSNPQSVTWRNPILLSYKKGKSVKKYCSKDCANIFSRFPQEISINKEGNSHYLYSTMKTPTIYVEFYSIPLDEETNTPLIPSDPILQEGLYKHLLYYYFKKLWINGEVSDLENKIKFLKDDAELAVAFCMNYSKFPSFNKMVQISKAARKKFSSFEILGRNAHY